MKQYDAIIIGFGKAGKTLAAELSNRGWQVAVVEQSDEMYGGACPNVACIPTKTLIHESEISTLLYHNDFDKQSNMYRQAIARKNKLTSFLRENNYEKLSKRPNVTIYTGKGSLVSRRRNRTAGKRDFYQYRLYTYYSQYRGDSAKSKCVHQYHSSGIGYSAKAPDYCRRRLYRTGVCFDVRRLRK